MARIRAMRRRPRATRPQPAPIHRFGDPTVDSAAREVRRGNAAIELTRLEFDLLDALSAHLLARTRPPAEVGDPLHQWLQPGLLDRPQVQHSLMREAKLDLADLSGVPLGVSP
jgi:hypothetical protein